MLGFRPVKPKAARPGTPPIPRRRSSSALPVIYEQDGSSNSDGRNNDGNSSDGSSSSSSYSEQSIIWPPANSPTWPPRDEDEPLIARWNDYGSLNCRQFDRYHRSASSGADSDVTEATSNRLADLHHNYTNSLSYSDTNSSLSWTLTLGSVDRASQYSFLNDSSFHRRQRVNPVILRVWHALSVLVMIAFCSSLVVMPSLLRQSEGKEHRDHDRHHGDMSITEQQQQQRQHEGEPQWNYPKPWKYLFGMGNDDNKVNETNVSSAEVGDADIQSSSDTSTVDAPASSNANQDEAMAALLSNVTFASLASITLPHYLQTTIELCKSTILPQDNHDDDDKQSKSLKKSTNTNHPNLSKFTTTSTLPNQVFALRKQLLKTRDLLDVFSPVYPPRQSKYHKGDLNFETRDIHYAKYNFGLEFEKDGRFKKGSSVADEMDTVDKRDMFGYDWNHHRDGRKKKRYKLTAAKGGKKKRISSDVWRTLRKRLDVGYTVIGTFQDLDHANIQYTEDELASIQIEVWNWYVDFLTWIEKEYLIVMRYLSHPCPANKSKSKMSKGSKGGVVSFETCQYSHLHSSHLFWGGKPENELPIGNITARTALGRLGSDQLRRAQAYLRQLWDKDHVLPEADVEEPIEKVRMPLLGRRKHADQSQYSAYDAPVEEKEDESVHEIYHNLRKELRSFLDEVDLFGTLLLPDAMVQSEVIVGLATDAGGNDIETKDDESTKHLGSALNVSVDQELGPQISPPVDPDPSSIDTTENHKQKTFDALSSLGQTRKLLGDLNDDYTAYTTYVEWDTNHGEQVRLMAKISTEWNNFRWWAGQIGLNEQIDYLIGRMSANVESIGDVDRDPPSPGEGDKGKESDEDSTEDAAGSDEETQAPAQEENTDPEPPDDTGDANKIGKFLMERKMHPTNHIVIGNDAGDADSIVSAIALAFIESVYESIPSTPVVSISRENFEKERPDVNLLFKIAGLNGVANELLFIEDLVQMLSSTEAASTHLDFTLVDHNTLNPSLNADKDSVRIVEIVDHHKDEGESIKTCSGNNRTIAYDQGLALVASACTLVAERLKMVCSAEHDSVCQYDETIATLLLGVILIDSVGLDESIGKVTTRDRDAVKDLIEHTDWKPSDSKSYLVANERGIVSVDVDLMFDTLQRAKYETAFWGGLDVARALSYDYKDFHTACNQTLGIASILMPGVDFMRKESFVSKTIEFMHINKISFLGIMFAFYNRDSNDTLKRQLAFCADETMDLDRFVQSMLSSDAYVHTDLKLEKSGNVPLTLDENDGLQLYLFDQENVKPSRKQIGPLLEEVYGLYQ